MDDPFSGSIESRDTYDVDFSRQSYCPNTFSMWKFIGRPLQRNKAPASSNEGSCQGKIKESVNASRKANRDVLSLDENWKLKCL